MKLPTVTFSIKLSVLTLDDLEQAFKVRKTVYQSFLINSFVITVTLLILNLKLLKLPLNVTQGHQQW